MCGNIHQMNSELCLQSVESKQTQKVYQNTATTRIKCEAQVLNQVSSVLNSVNAGVFQVEQSKVLIKEGGVQLTLTIVDTPGFGDAVDNSNW